MKGVETEVLGLVYSRVVLQYRQHRRSCRKGMSPNVGSNRNKHANKGGCPEQKSCNVREWVILSSTVVYLFKAINELSIIDTGLAVRSELGDGRHNVQQHFCQSQGFSSCDRFTRREAIGRFILKGATRAAADKSSCTGRAVRNHWRAGAPRRVVCVNQC